MAFLSRPLPLVFLVGCFAGAQTAATQIPPEIKIGAPQTAASGSAAKSKLQLQQEADFDVRYAQAVALRKAHDFAAAVRKFQEAEQLAANLTDTKYSWLQEVLAGEADCFLQLKRYEEAEAALIRRKNALEIATKELDESYPHNFSLLADLSARQQNWKEAEQYLQQALKAHDKVLAHLAGPGTNATQLRDERRAKAIDQFHLGLIYAREERYADALVALDESFTAASETHAPGSQLTPIATAAKEIAVHTGFPDDVKKWHTRLAALSEGEPTAPKN
jgi:tetratricopeptide (TPR) repeat protein